MLGLIASNTIMAFSTPSVQGMLRRVWLAMATLLGLAALSACAGTRGGPIPYNVENFGQPDSQVAQTVDPNYKVAPADTLKIIVFQVPDLTGEFDVDILGNISLPLIGDIKAADLTIAELDQSITQRLGEKYLQRPDVTVALKASARRNVTVDGAVNQPGMYAVNGPTTLIQALAMARGVSSEANPHRVAIFRQIEGKRMGAAFDLTSVRKGQMQDPQIYAGDIIVVEGSSVKAIQNQVLMSLPVIGLFNPIM